MAGGSAKPAPSPERDFVELIQEYGCVHDSKAKSFDKTQKIPSYINLCSKTSDSKRKTNAPHRPVPLNSLQILDSTDNSQMQVPDLGANKKIDVLNFSLFSKPAVVFATQESPKIEELDMKKKRVIAAERKDAGSPQKFISSTNKSPKALMPEHSKKKRNINQVPVDASSIAAIPAKENCYTVESSDPLASSVCSRKISNNPRYQSKRKYQGIEKSANLGANVEDKLGVAAKAARKAGNTGGKRIRTAEVHNLSERRRRDKINRKMSELQELIPNCNKVDKVSILDEAIDYLKTLKLQHQLMSTLSGIQQIHAPHMTHFSSTGFGIDMMMGLGTGSSHAQFSSFLNSGTTALSGTAFQLLGLPIHVIFPMSMSNAPFIPPPCEPPSQSVLQNLSKATYVAEPPTSVPDLCTDGNAEDQPKVIA